MLDRTIVVAVSEDASAIELLLPHWTELIAGVVAFGLVFFFVWKWAWPKINKTMETRQAAIADGYSAAEKAKAEAESIRGDYQAQLADSKAEANRMVEEARVQAEESKAEIIAKAQAEAEQIRAKAREDAASELSRALAEAQGQVGSISVDLASKIVGESLDAAAHQDLIDRYLADLERL